MIHKRITINTSVYETNVAVEEMKSKICMARFDFLQPSP